jgi:fused signal recognition particle receptor
MGLFSRIKSGLKKTRGGIMGRMESLFSRNAFDEAFYEELEEILVGADVGIKTTTELVEKLRELVRVNKIKEADQVRDILKRLILELFEKGSGDSGDRSDNPTVILVLGVNGVGKTTTIGKLASRHRQQGKRVLLVAGDTFRAAAIEQLEIWADRAGADIVRHQQGSDPAAVVFDGMSAAKARAADIVLCDTAGRLHNKTNLMDELKKIYRVIEKAMTGAPHEVLLVLDATTGQNALVQARVFNEAVPLTGLVLTKLDGTAKGGIVIAVANELAIPVRYVGVGEGVDDLQAFDPQEYVEALFAREE